MQGKAGVESTRSCRCECPALINCLDQRAIDGASQSTRVKKYMRLQFDSESEENYDEEMTRIVR